MKDPKSLHVLTPEERRAAVATARVISDLRDERRRQVDVEGYGARHDEGYAGLELERAAAAYAIAPPDAKTPPWPWPWHPSFWKPTTHRRNLVKAGALIIAAIEKIDRDQAQADGATRQ